MIDLCVIRGERVYIHPGTITIITMVHRILPSRIVSTMMKSGMIIGILSSFLKQWNPLKTENGDIHMMYHSILVV